MQQIIDQNPVGMIPPGIYELDEPLIIDSGYKLFGYGCTLKPSASFVGCALVVVERNGGLDGVKDFLFEGFTLDLNYQVDKGIFVRSGQEGYLSNLIIKKALKVGIHVGDPSSSYKSFEIHMDKIKIKWEGGQKNTADTVGIFYDWCSDANVNDCVVEGYRTGFKTASTAGSINIKNGHPWTDGTNDGPMQYGFNIAGWSNRLINPDLDTPTSIGQPVAETAITECYGVYVSGNYLNIIGGRCFLNSSVGQDGMVYGVYNARYDAGQKIIVRDLLFSNASDRRFIAKYGGYTEFIEATDFGDNFVFGNLLDFDFPKNKHSINQVFVNFKDAISFSCVNGRDYVDQYGILRQVAVDEVRFDWSAIDRHLILEGSELETLYLSGTQFSSWYNGEGTFVISGIIDGASNSVNRIIELSDGTTNNIITLEVKSNLKLQSQIKVSGASSWLTTDEIITVGVPFTAFLAVKSGKNSLRLNNGVIKTNTGTIPTVSQMYVGRDFSGTYPVDARLRKIQFHPKALI